MVDASNMAPNPDLSNVVECVVVLVKDDDDRVLLASATEVGPWSFLGGPVNEGETLERAATRIPFDDCGIKIALGRKTVELRGEKYRVLYECGQDVTWRATVFEATLGADAPDVNAPMISRWFSFDEIRKLHLDEFAIAAATDLAMR